MKSKCVYAVLLLITLTCIVFLASSWLIPSKKATELSVSPGPSVPLYQVQSDKGEVADADSIQTEAVVVTNAPDENVIEEKGATFSYATTSETSPPVLTEEQVKSLADVQRAEQQKNAVHK